MPEHVPYKIDKDAGLKPMEESERFVGGALMLIGTVLRSAMANGMKLTGLLGIGIAAFLDAMKNPTTAAIMVTAIVMLGMGVVWVAGVILDKIGFRKKKKGEATATQGLY